MLRFGSLGGVFFVPLCERSFLGFAYVEEKKSEVGEYRERAAELV